MSIKTANLGFPRMGRHRELKFALEAYWSGRIDQQALLETARTLRGKHWQLQQQHGIDVIPSNDFSLYDHVLDTAVMVGAMPEGYGWSSGTVGLDTYFALARGSDIMEAIIAMDADVISIETSRSKMELLDAFAGERYPNEIGPGVYDIHSPRVPSAEEIVDLVERASRRLDIAQIWINPDCGLKTRRWEDVKLALVHMVEAARRLRRRLAESDGWRVSA